MPTDWPARLRTAKRAAAGSLQPPVRRGRRAAQTSGSGAAPGQRRRHRWVAGRPRLQARGAVSHCCRCCFGFEGFTPACRPTPPAGPPNRPPNCTCIFRPLMRCRGSPPCRFCCHPPCAAAPAAVKRKTPEPSTAPAAAVLQAWQQPPAQQLQAAPGGLAPSPFLSGAAPAVPGAPPADWFAPQPAAAAAFPPAAAAALPLAAAPPGAAAAPAAAAATAQAAPAAAPKITKIKLKLPGAK